MANQTSFTPDEWTLLRTVPSFVAGGVSAADPSGIFSSVKEATAGMRGMLESLTTGKHIELFSAMVADRSMPAMPDARSLLGEGARDQQLANLKTAVLAKIRDASDLVARKASADEATAYKDMIYAVADKAANASNEGGFLGFGGVRVSAAEQSFLNEVKVALGR